MQESSAPGSFYAFVPRSPALTSWLSLTRRNSEKLVHQKLDAAISSWEEDAPISNNDDTLSTPSGLYHQASLPTTQSYVYKNAGLTVKVGLEEVASDLFRVKPYVYSTPDNSAVIVFSGSLQNLSELTRRGPRPMGRRSSSPIYSDYNNATSASLERKSSIERSLDVGQLTASTVLNMYLEGQQEGNELIMLSELQGEFAFVIYDNKHKQPFAARDPSGEEHLYYHVTEDGAISFASDRLAIPDGEQPHEWHELPPGHYISGKVPKLHQFALTPQQLALREIEQEDELEAVSPRRRSLILDSKQELHLGSLLSHRTSLDNDRLIKDRALDADVFALDL
eukprot:GHUV01001695.1.p1 GENE.GHUV01001695.1~~GHUV01001695.1.p1  ORF type:complete len:338 (+),score=71.75 GHUV01001695.1:200-1213(+)